MLDRIRFVIFGFDEIDKKIKNYENEIFKLKDTISILKKKNSNYLLEILKLKDTIEELKSVLENRVKKEFHCVRIDGE